MRINEGDTVEVQFERCPWFRGKVLYTPCATGDSWRIKEENGTLHYVQGFAQMILVELAPQKERTGEK